MERLENKIERVNNEKTFLKQEVESLKIWVDFQNSLKKQREIQRG